MKSRKIKLRNKKSRKYKQKGGWLNQGIRIMGIPIEKSKPGLFDGRTCYSVGPFKWCTRANNKNK